jgi:hypothetical protein
VGAGKQLKNLVVSNFVGPIDIMETSKSEFRLIKKLPYLALWVMKFGSTRLPTTLLFADAQNKREKAEASGRNVVRTDAETKKSSIRVMLVPRC